jgi:hypothetical protein
MEIDEEYIDKVKSFIEQKDAENVKALLIDLHPADIAELCNDLAPEEARFVYRLLDNETAADVLVEMDEDVRKEFLELLPSETIAKRFVDYMDTDDAVDLIYDSPDRIYFVIEDSLTLIAKKRRGFIDTDSLYKYEKILRQHGGSSLAIHHTNKSGIFADTQQIENYADYTYLLERNEFNSSILVHPQKASRYDIKGRAYLIENRKIVKEVDYDMFNISQRESKFVMYVIDALEDGEMNQSEILSYLEKVKFFSDYKVGQKKTIKWLQIWGDKGKWIYEQRANEKNAIFYRLKSESEKLAKLPNTEKRDSIEIMTIANENN